MDPQRPPAIAGARRKNVRDSPAGLEDAASREELARLIERDGIDLEYLAPVEVLAMQLAFRDMPRGVAALSGEECRKLLRELEG